MPTFRHLYSSALDYELGTDDSTRLFTDDRRKASIQEGVDQFADLTECFPRQSTIASSHGVGEYSLLAITDYARLAKQRPEYQRLSSAGAVLTYVAGEAFTRRDVEWLNQYEPGWRTSTAGTPRYYYEREDGGRRFFGLYPPPEIGTSQTAKVVLPYVAKAPALATDTAVPFQIGADVRTDLEMYHQASVHYAAHKLEKLRGNTEASQSQMQIFLGWVQRYLGDKKPKGGTTIKHARSYFNESKRARIGDGHMTGWGYE